MHLIAFEKSYKIFVCDCDFQLVPFLYEISGSSDLQILNQTLGLLEMIYPFYLFPESNYFGERKVLFKKMHC